MRILKKIVIVIAVLLGIYSVTGFVVFPIVKTFSAGRVELGLK